MNITISFETILWALYFGGLVFALLAIPVITMDRGFYHWWEKPIALALVVFWPITLAVVVILIILARLFYWVWED